MEILGTISIDIETYSDRELKKCGVFKYAASPNFEILSIAYCYDDGPVHWVDLTKDPFPQQLEIDIQDVRYIKTSYNAAFELECLSIRFKTRLDPRQWRCTLVKAGMLGLPMNLAEVSRVLKLVEGKLESGVALINYFCKPCTPTQANGFRTRNLPHHAPEKWAEFMRYMVRDVVAERGLLKKISWFTVPAKEQKLWELDQKINRLGVAVDIDLIKNAIKINEEYQAVLIEEAVKITGLQNVKSVAQLKKWLQKEAEDDPDELHEFDGKASLKSEDLPALIKKFDSEKIKRVLQIRQETSKTSITKYATMLNAAGDDGRVRGTLQFCGANRTWRWAGRLIQPHNYPKNNMKELDLARMAVKTGQMGIVNACFDSVSHVLSQLLRTAFIPAKGREFIIDDYNSIEARILAWLAGEEWVLDVFRGHGLIYEATAANMFKVPIETIGKKSPLRQRGKICTLALGYQGAVGALLKMRALEMGIPENELPKLVTQYRQANPNIVQFWYTLQDSAITAIQTGEVVPVTKGIRMQYKRNCLFITLPSGRDLVYCNASISGNNLTYWGVNQTKKTWVRLESYGGKLAENITQAIARDILAEGLLNLDAHGYDIPLHIHDEVLIEHPEDQGDLATVSRLMCPPITWAKGLPLSAEGFKHRYYKKED
jgi:DNA polymerase